MHIHHAVLPEDLANGGEEALVKYYWKSLQDLLNQQHPAENYQYSYDEAWRLSIIGRRLLSLFLGSLLEDSDTRIMQLKADSKNTNLNRSVPPYGLCRSSGPISNRD
jgi:hypothetical protein